MNKLPPLDASKINSVYEQAQILNRQKKYQEAEFLYKKLLEALPDNPMILSSASAHYTERSMFTEAKRLITKAKRLLPGNINLLKDEAFFYLKQNDRQKYVKTLESIIELSPDDLFAATSLLHNEMALANFDRMKVLSEKFLKSDNPTIHDCYKVCNSIINYLENDFDSAAKNIDNLKFFKNIEEEDFDQSQQAYANYRAYGHYIFKLLEWGQENQEAYSGQDLPHISFIGDSHAFGLANLAVSIKGEQRCIKTKLTFDSNLWQVAGVESPYRKNLLKKLLRESEGEQVLLSLGEPDVRPMLGFHKQVIRNSDFPLEEKMTELLDKFFGLLTKYVKGKDIEIIFVAPPAPAHKYSLKLTNNDEKICDEYIKIPVLFNQLLIEKCNEYKISCADLFSVTNRGDGWSKDDVHIDGVHLKPNILIDLINSQAK